MATANNRKAAMTSPLQKHAASMLAASTGHATWTFKPWDEDARRRGDLELRTDSSPSYAVCVTPDGALYTPLTDRMLVGDAIRVDEWQPACDGRRRIDRAMHDVMLTVDSKRRSLEIVEKVNDGSYWLEPRGAQIA